ncbi:DUF3228 family protein [Candidatus Uhrbacteria bacterium]|nr:DUF3228 family protein [Candidatus Uhrbacteria bacterium]
MIGDLDWIPASAGMTKKRNLKRKEYRTTTNTERGARKNGGHMPAIGVNEFVRRQTAGSRFSHFDGTFETLAALVAANFESGKPGYKDGVLLVPLSPEGFWCGVVEVGPGMTLHATFEARRPGEAGFIQVVVTGGAAKHPAEAVDIVLYRRDVLGDEATTPDADWEIISVNARATVEEEPMTPVAMARNYLNLPGGTPASYTAEEFARAVMYWSTRAMLGETT